MTEPATRISSAHTLKSTPCVVDFSKGVWTPGKCEL